MKEDLSVCDVWGGGHGQEIGDLAGRAAGLEQQQGNDTVCVAKFQPKLSQLALKPVGELLEGVGEPLEVESPTGRGVAVYVRVEQEDRSPPRSSEWPS